MQPTMLSISQTHKLKQTEIKTTMTLSKNIRDYMTATK